MTVVTNPACTENGPNGQISQPSTSRMQAIDSTSDYGHHIRSIHIETLRQYKEELRNEIVFVAGMNGDTSRFPGNRLALTSSNPVFAALLSVKTNVIIVDHVDRRGFEQLIRYQYCKPLQLTSVYTARATLDAAYKFLCPELAEHCARHLDEMLDAEAALEVLRDLRFLCAQLPGAASAPPLPALQNDDAAQALSLCAMWCDSLAHNVLLLIDDNADAVLTHERIEDLAYEDLVLIVKRNTLRVSSELVLAEALARWSTAACKRYKRELTPSNKRATLGELAYCPRYLLLAGEELDRVLALELLQPIERALVIARARKLSAPVPVGAEQEAMLRRWAQPRPTTPAAAPVHLSPRSEIHEEPQPTKLCARRPRKLKQQPFELEEDTNNNNCCSGCFHGLIHALVCLFD